MAKKNRRTEKPPREYSRRQLSRWEQQNKRQRIIFGVGVAIIATVLAVLGVGWYVNEYRPLHETVIRVNDTEFDMNYYIDRLKLYGVWDTVFYLYAIVDDAEQSIEQDEMIKQGAMAMGISVSDSELDEALKDYKSEVSDSLRDAVRGQLLRNKLKDEHFEHQVSLTAKQRQIMAMFLESESQAAEVRGRLEAGEDFTELAGELSLESLTRDNKGDIGWRSEEVLPLLLDTPVPGEYAFSAEVGTLSPLLEDEDMRKGVGYWLIKVEEKKDEPEQARVRAMLLGSEEEARQVRDRIAAGEDFAKLAGELSQHDASRESQGDVGWISPGEATEAFEGYVFGPETEVGEVSPPVRDEETVTTGGYWLVKVLAVDDNREIGQEDRERLKDEALNLWFAELRKDPSYEAVSYMDDQTKRWAADKAYQEQMSESQG